MNKQNSHIIQRMHASNVGAYLAGHTASLVHNDIMPRHQMRKSSTNARPSLTGHGPKPSTQSANAKRRAQIKQLLLMPHSSHVSTTKSAVKLRNHSLNSAKQSKLHVAHRIGVNRSINLTDAISSAFAPRQKAHMQTEADEFQFSTNARQTTAPEQASNYASVERATRRITRTGLMDRRHDSEQRQLVKEMKETFEVVYQPQVNICSGQKEASPAKSEADSSAMQVSSRGRKLQAQEEPAAEPVELAEEVCSVRSEEYVYKSPSKMTSPEKKAFS